MRHWSRQQRIVLIAVAAVAAAFVIIRHKDNIKRLLNGTESKIRQGHAEDLKK